MHIGIFLLIALLSGKSYAQELHSSGEQYLSELLSEVSSHHKDYHLEPENKWICDGRISENDLQDIGVEYSQYIFNTHYVWAEVHYENESCIFMISPVYRPLSARESEVFIKASNTEFVPSDASKTNTIHPVIVPSNDVIENHADSLYLESESESGKGDIVNDQSAGKSQNIGIMTDINFPNNTIALLQAGPGNGTVQGTAVQLSPYVFVTAAHNLVNRDTGGEYGNVRIFPKYKVPNATPGIRPVAAIYNPSYINQSNQWRAYAQDVAFIKLAHPQPISRYPVVWTLGNTESAPVITGNLFSDPYSIQWVFSTVHGCIPSMRIIGFWIVPTHTICGEYSRTYTSISSIGYPLYVGQVDNRALKNPYVANPQIQGYPTDPQANYGLFHPGFNGYASHGFGYANVYGGMSGGPVFVTFTTQYNSRPNDLVKSHYLIAINNSTVSGGPPNPYFVASGKSRNLSFWQEHEGWVPSFNISASVSSPHTMSSDWSKNIQIFVRSPGVPAVDIYRSKSGMQPEPEELIAVAGDGDAITQNIIGGSGTANVYKYRMFARADYTAPLAEYYLYVFGSGQPPYRGGAGDFLD